MRIAVTSADDAGLEGMVSPHFGQCPYFTIVDVTDNEIQAVTVVANPHYTSHRPGEVPSLVRSHNAEMIVAGGMGRRAIGLFQELGIQAFTGAQGTVRQSLELALGGHLIDAAPCAGHGRDVAHGGHERKEQMAE